MRQHYAHRESCSKEYVLSCEGATKVSDLSSDPPVDLAYSCSSAYITYVLAVFLDNPSPFSLAHPHSPRTSGIPIGRRHSHNSPTPPHARRSWSSSRRLAQIVLSSEPLKGLRNICDLAKFWWSFFVVQVRALWLVGLAGVV